MVFSRDRLRLLEFHTLSLDETVERACALESEKIIQLLIRSVRETLMQLLYLKKMTLENSTNIAIVHSNYKTFYFCGLSSHKSSQKYTAFNAKCDNCKKNGHWAVVLVEIQKELQVRST